MSTVEGIKDNRDGYGDGGDMGQQQMRCGTTEMAHVEFLCCNFLRVEFLCYNKIEEQ